MDGISALMMFYIKLDSYEVNLTLVCLYYKIGDKNYGNYMQSSAVILTTEA